MAGVFLNLAVVSLAALDQWFAAHLEQGSYFFLFGVLFCCGLGLPVPEDIPLLFSGALVANGKMNLALVCVCAWCGIVGGDVVLYHLGRKFGLEVRKAPLIGRHLSQKRLDQVHGLFEKYGIWVVAVGRMFAGFRGAMVFVAGTTRFKFWKFLLADGIAALFSGGLFVFLGYQFGKNMHVLREHVEKGKKWTLVLVLIVAAVIGIWVYLHRRNKSDEAADSGIGNSVPATDEPA